MPAFSSRSARDVVHDPERPAVRPRSRGPSFTTRSHRQVGGFLRNGCHWASSNETQTPALCRRNGPRTRSSARRARTRRRNPVRDESPRLAVVADLVDAEGCPRRYQFAATYAPPARNATPRSSRCAHSPSVGGETPHVVPLSRVAYTRPSSDKSTAHRALVTGEAKSWRTSRAAAVRRDRPSGHPSVRGSARVVAGDFLKVSPPSAVLKSTLAPGRAPSGHAWRRSAAWSNSQYFVSTRAHCPCPRQASNVRDSPVTRLIR
jgi:hypothetical protein